MNGYNTYNVPFTIPVPGGMAPGKMVTIQGTIPPMSQRFAVNLLCRSGDIALHVCPRFKENRVVRNNVKNMIWGPEESHGGLPVYPGQSFELLILCEAYDFKISFNGRHFAEFSHREPFNAIINLAVDGDVVVQDVSFKEQNNYGNNNTQSSGPYGFQPGAPSSNYNSGGLYPAIDPYPSNPTSGQAPSALPRFPVSSPYYPTQPNYGNQIPHQGPYPQVPHPQTGGYNPTPHTRPGFLDQAGAALAGVLGPGLLAGGGMNNRSNTRPQTYGSGVMDQAGRALSGILGGFGSAGNNHNKHNKLGGVLGGTLGTAVAGAALTGHLNPIKAAKKQRKAQKKALKYGLPLAGAGLGVYALHKGFKGFRRSSSSSSCSSSD